MAYKDKGWGGVKGSVTGAVSDVPLIGSLVNTWSGAGANKANNNAQQNIDQAKAAYDNLGDVPLPADIHAQSVGTNAITAHDAASTASLDPQAQAAQRAQMAALGSLAANGGRSAVGDANLAHIQAQQGAQAQGMRGAVLQDAARRGMGGSNQALLAQLSANQAAGNTAAMQGADLAASQAQLGLQAGQGAAGIGASLQGQSDSQAQAKDLMARFNSGENLNAQQFNSQQQFDAGRFNSGSDLAAQQYNSQAPMQQYGAKLATAGGKAGTNAKAADYWGNKYGEDQRAQGQATAGAIGAVTSLINGSKNGPQGSAGAASMFARGGEVPGPELVKGDSLLNDVVPYKGPKGPINLSGGEVVVPKTMRHASDSEIASFVKHPPKTEAPHDRERSMRLSALNKLRTRG